MTSEALLEADGVSKAFVTTGWSGLRRTARRVVAVRDASFALRRGETIGIVGESGSGKTTLARMLVHLIRPTAGTIRFKGQDMHALSEPDVRSIVRPSLRMIFQDADATLNPAYAVGQGLLRALQLHQISVAQPTAYILEAMEELGLNQSFFRKYPDELSGGEKRRLGVCRALLTNPEVIVADEPLSGLDVLLQELVLGLLMREQDRRGFGLILVSHDLERVNQICDRVLVMHAGHIVEDMRIYRKNGQAIEDYRHPYSVLLRGAHMERPTTLPPVTPSLGQTGVQNGGIQGDPTAGCPVVDICPRWLLAGKPEQCLVARPALEPCGPDHAVACHFTDGSAASADE